MDKKESENSLLKKYLEVQESFVKRLEERDGATDNGSNIFNDRNRKPYERDYARAIYSNAFRRQQGKMQLLEVNGKQFHRNRLTHSLEVSQIARSIVHQLKAETKSDDIDFEAMSRVVETGALIHDIGNPPFGHHGERVLNELSGELGFEGNAQGMRILRKIAKKSPKYPGLLLTYRTLASILKYNVNFEKDKDGNYPKKFIYPEDFEFLNEKFESVRSNLSNEDNQFKVGIRTIDVQIVDLADQIAYCAHDLEDALAGDYFNIDNLLFLLSKEEERIGKAQLEGFKNWVKLSKEFAAEASPDDDYDFYFRSELRSHIVHYLIRDIGLVEVNSKDKKETGTQNDYEINFKKYAKLAEILKRKTFECVNLSNEVILYEKVGTKVLTKLFELFMNDSFNKDGMLMPTEYRFNVNDDLKVKKRKVLDYISGMMDTYAIELYQKYFGEDPFEKKYDVNIFKEPEKISKKKYRYK